MIDEASLRGLIAQQESPRLDFKKEMYDWDHGGDAELAKDIMAIANTLPRASDVRGYIIVGVEEVEPDRTGNLVGFTPSDKLSDAEMHEKIKDKLNRLPEFQYGITRLDGRQLAVFEISPGDRPYYALKDVNGRDKKLALRRNAAYYRTGSRNDTAPPPVILGWANEDDPTKRRLVELQLAEAEAKLALHPRLVPNGSVTSAGKFSIKASLVNDGTATFKPVSIEWRWSLPLDDLRRWGQQHKTRILAAPAPLVLSVALPPGVVRADQSAQITSEMEQSALDRHFRTALIGCSEGDPDQALPTIELAVGELIVECEGQTDLCRASTSLQYRWGR